MSIKQAIEALETCPFCGNAPRHLEHKAGFYSERVICDSCSFYLSPEAWNRRAALRSMPAEPVNDALNTLCKLMHSGEEVEGDDGLAMLVPMDLWNEAQEAIELLVGEDDTTPHTAPLSDAWISVDERLPGEQGCDSEEVMLFINGHCEITDMECRQGGAWGLRLGYFDAEKQAFRVHGRPESFVTHWQALPPPPVEQATAARLGVKLGDTRHADQA